MLKKVSSYVLVMALFFSMSLSVYAETGNGTGGMGTATGGMTGTQGYRTVATDNGTDWGWIGLLGLVGLAGLMGRNRNPNRG